MKINKHENSNIESINNQVEPKSKLEKIYFRIIDFIGKTFVNNYEPILKIDTQDTKIDISKKSDIDIKEEKYSKSRDFSLSAETIIMISLLIMVCLYSFSYIFEKSILGTEVNIETSGSVVVQNYNLVEVSILEKQQREESETGNKLYFVRYITDKGEEYVEFVSYDVYSNSNVRTGRILYASYDDNSGEYKLEPEIER